MTPQEIIKEIQKLPPIQKKEVLDGISLDDFLSEEKISEELLARGVIKEIPEDWNKPDEDFDPIEIKGEPLSETVIEDRG